MEERNADQVLIRKYLLCAIGEEEREAVERRMLTDTEFFEQVELAEDDLVDDYADNTLSPDERKKFEASFLTTPEGRQQVNLAFVLRKKAEIKKNAKIITPSPIPVSWWNRALANNFVRVAALIIIALGLSLMVWRTLFNSSEVEKGIAALQEAYASQRPTEARISALDTYAPNLTTRGQPGQVTNKNKLEAAEITLRQAALSEQSAKAYHALGQYYLATRDFDKAIENFKKALEKAPRQATIHSDLGAAYLEYGKTLFDKPNGKAVETLAQSLEPLAKALEIDNSLLSARFNYALALQLMGLSERAKEEWQNYLERDSQSKWADEAREKLKQLNEQIGESSLTKQEVLGRFLEAYKNGNDEKAWELIYRNREPISGRFITEQLLDEFLNKKLSGEEAAAKASFAALRYASALEAQRADEQYPKALANFYEKQPKENLTELKSARDLVQQGHELFFRDESKPAADNYTQAKALFKRFGDDAEMSQAEYWSGYCQQNLVYTNSGLEVYDQLEKACKEKKFKWLAMRILYYKSSYAFSREKYSEAIKLAELALQTAEGLKDSLGVMICLDSLIEFYRFIGNNSRSLACIQNGLLKGLCQLNQMQQQVHYLFVARSLSSAALYNAAIEYHKEALQIVINVPNDLSMFYAFLGENYLKLKDYAKALETTLTAYNVAQRIPNEQFKNFKTAYAALQLGHIHSLTKAFDKALASYSEALQIFTDLDTPLLRYKAHKGKFLCQAALGEDQLANQELLTTLQLVERSRLNIWEEDNRNNFFDAEQSIYDLAIEYEESRMNNPQQAFEYSEAFRARSLLDAKRSKISVVSDGTYADLRFKKISSVLPLADIKARLPEQTQLVQYSVLENQMVIWVISKSGLSDVAVPVSETALNETVKDYLRKISQPPEENGEEALKAASAELYKLLIQPVDPVLDKTKTLYLIPDKALYFLPFESLYSPLTNRYLIEDYCLAYSPSASVFTLCSEEAKKKEAVASEHLLSVGNPTFDRALFQELADLPEARREAEKIADDYPTAVTLTERNAKKEPIQAEMEKSEVIHLATHSILDEYSPLQSKILLAKTAADDKADEEGTNRQPGGVLESQDIYRMRLPRTRLVVLSSCQSGIDRYYRGEGMLNFARPFIAIGVPLVVASLWKVDSKSTQDLMIAFHHSRKREKCSSIQSLRKAKVEMLHKSEGRFRHPFYWASFILIGGDANF